MLRRRRAANVVINDNGEPVIKHGLRHQPWASAQASETALLERIPERNTPGHEGQRGAPDHSDLPRGNTLADSRQLPRCQAVPTAMNYVATADIYVVDQWVGCLRRSASEVQGEEPWGDARRRRLPKNLFTAATARKTCQKRQWRRLPNRLLRTCSVLKTWHAFCMP